MDYKYQVFINDNRRPQNAISRPMSSESYDTTTNEETDNSFTRNSIKQNISQNSTMNINKEFINRRKKRKLYRKKTPLGDIPDSISGFWNWQFETGTWKEIGLDLPKKKRKKRREKNTRRQRNMMVCNPKTNANLERFTLNFFEVSSATTRNTSGKTASYLYFRIYHL